MLCSALTLLLACFPAALQVDDPSSGQWLLVAGNQSDHPGIDLDRVGKLYLSGRSWQRCTIEDLPTAGPGSRWLIGTPAGCPPVASALREHGIEVRDRGLVFRGRVIPAGYGLIFKTPGLAVFTGVDPAGVYSCFTTSANVDPGPAVVVHAGQRIPLDTLERVAVEAEFENMFQLHRVDRLQLDALLRGAGKPGDRALRAARAVGGWEQELRWMFGSGPAPRDDLFRFHLWLERNATAALKRVDADFGEVDLEAELGAILSRCRERLGETAVPAPLVVALVALPTDSNAMTVDLEPWSGRPRVLLNLAAFRDLRQLRVVAAHEFVHCWQMSSRGSLSSSRLVNEGVATYLGQLLVPGTTDVEALMWDESRLAAAVTRHDQAVEFFLRDLNQGRDRSWFYLGTPPPNTGNPPLPDRTGYYLGWWAARQWHQQHSIRPLADLLHLDVAELTQALTNG